MSSNQFNVFDEFENIAKGLHEAGIQYALVGGVAMAFYAEPRLTKDIDILIAAKDIDALAKVLAKFDYFTFAAPWALSSTGLTLHRFLKAVENSESFLDALVGTAPDYVKMIADAKTIINRHGVPVRIAQIDDLVALKKARSSTQDEADIERLNHEKPDRRI